MTALTPNAELRRVHLGDILTATTGVLVAPTGMAGLQELLEWMTGGLVWTHQLGRAADACQPVLLAQFPWVAGIVTPDWSGVRRGEAENAVGAWLAGQAAVHGEWHAVGRIPAGAFELINPVAELAEKLGADRVRVVDVPPNAGSAE